MVASGEVLCVYVHSFYVEYCGFEYVPHHLFSLVLRKYISIQYNFIETLSTGYFHLQSFIKIVLEYNMSSLPLQAN